MIVSRNDCGGVMGNRTLEHLPGVNTGVVNVSVKHHFKRKGLVFGVQENDAKDLVVHPGQFQFEEATDL